MDEPVIVIQTALFTSDYNYRAVHVLTSFLQSIVRICGHFLIINNRRYGLCYVNIFISLCTFLEFNIHLEANSARSFQNAFYKCSGALNIVFLKNCNFD